MQDNSFITKMTGRGELPIGKMPGFEPPDDETHEIILERFKKQMRKETVSTVFWTIMSLFFIITYIVMYFRMDAKADAKKGILVALAAFVVIAVVTIYKYVFIDKKADAIVKSYVFPYCCIVSFYISNDISYNLPPFVDTKIYLQIHIDVYERW